MTDLDYPECFDDMSEDRKYRLLSWIAQNLIPRDNFNERYTSYSLKDFIKDEHFSNGEFKGAMKKLGYRVQDESKLNWVFNVSQRSPAVLYFREH